MTLEVVDVSKSFPGPDGPVHVLDGISFTAKSGTSTSIIGPNGAGKSTLLRVVSGIVPPTSGRVLRPRRCGSLIELGAGFHPDLTGRENLVVALSLDGRTSRHRARAVADAIRFADIGDAIDRPVKHLSTGMIGRLACSAVLQSSPELLVVDEVLAVGDAGFQRRMLDAIAEMTYEGTALLLVTHSPELAAATTTRTIWIDAGRVIADGSTPDVLTGYEAAVRGWGRSFEPSQITIVGVELRPRHIRPAGALAVEIDLDARANAGPIALRVELRPTVGDEPWMRSNEDSLEVWHLNLIAATNPVRIEHLRPGRHRVRIEIDSVPISPSEVELTVLLSDHRRLIVDEVPLTLPIGESSLRPIGHLEARLEPHADDQAV